MKKKKTNRMKNTTTTTNTSSTTATNNNSNNYNTPTITTQKHHEENKRYMICTFIGIFSCSEIRDSIVTRRRYDSNAYIGSRKSTRELETQERSASDKSTYLQMFT